MTLLSAGPSYWMQSPDDPYVVLGSGVCPAGASMRTVNMVLQTPIREQQASGRALLQFLQVQVMACRRLFCNICRSHKEITFNRCLDCVCRSSRRTRCSSTWQWRSGRMQPTRDCEKLKLSIFFFLRGNCVHYRHWLFLLDVATVPIGLWLPQSPLPVLYRKEDESLNEILPSLRLPWSARSLSMASQGAMKRMADCVCCRKLP